MILTLDLTLVVCSKFGKFSILVLDPGFEDLTQLIWQIYIQIRCLFEVFLLSNSLLQFFDCEYEVVGVANGLCVTTVKGITNNQIPLESLKELLHFLELSNQLQFFFRKCINGILVIVFEIVDIATTNLKVSPKPVLPFLNMMFQNLTQIVQQEVQIEIVVVRVNFCNYWNYAVGNRGQ